MTKNIRRQLTLFVEEIGAEIIEKVRRKFNPKQMELIKCHVNLCREDEIANLDPILINLALVTQAEIVIDFGEATRFDNGNGLLIPATNGHLEFQELRRQILSGINNNPKRQEPHITLMHLPIDTSCTDVKYTKKANQVVD